MVDPLVYRMLEMARIFACFIIHLIDDVLQIEKWLIMSWINAIVLPAYDKRGGTWTIKIGI